jgi:hypothetical protein
MGDSVKRFALAQMVGGWFVGDFEPTAFRTPAAEVCYKRHRAGEAWPSHYHAVATEVNLLVRGEMRLGDTVLQAGDIFTLSPNEIAAPTFVTDCELVVVKVPSVEGDKYIVS